MSKPKQIPLAEATKEQLAAFATLICGLEVKPKDSAEAIRAKIAQVWQNDFITLPEADPGEAAAEGAPPPKPAEMPTTYTPAQVLNAGDSSRDPRVNVRIPEEAKPGGKRHVPVGVNGRLMLIPRNKDVDIPLRYYFALIGAEQENFEQDLETGEIDSAKTLNYPVIVNSLPPKEVIDAWLKSGEANIERAERLAAEKKARRMSAEAA